MSSAARTSVPVILNPAARCGEARERVAPLRTALAARGIEAELVESRSGEHATEVAAALAAQGVPVVVSLGGDGMVRSVAAGLVGTDTSLGIIAGGRGNDFIGKLGIPKAVEAAAAIVAEGRDRRIDVLDLDGRICVGNVSLGLDSTVQQHADSVRRVKGHWAYTYGLGRSVLRPRCIDLVLTIDGEQREFRGYSAGFANSGRYGGGLRLSPSATVDDGLLDVVLLHDVPFPRLGVQLVAFNLGQHERHPDIGFLRAREARIDTPAGDAPIEIFADGDVVAHTPATVRIRPRVLSVRVPCGRSFR